MLWWLIGTRGRPRGSEYSDGERRAALRTTLAETRLLKSAAGAEIVFLDDEHVHPRGSRCLSAGDLAIHWDGCPVANRGDVRRDRRGHGRILVGQRAVR